MIVEVDGFDDLIFLVLPLSHHLDPVLLLETYLIELLHYLYQHQVHVVVDHCQTLQTIVIGLLVTLVSVFPLFTLLCAHLTGFYLDLRPSTLKG